MADILKPKPKIQEMEQADDKQKEGHRQPFLGGKMGYRNKGFVQQSVSYTLGHRQSQKLN